MSSEYAKMPQLRSSATARSFQFSHFLQVEGYAKCRYGLKKVLVHHMGLSFSREQPLLSLSDVEAAGLLPALFQVAESIGLPRQALPQQAPPLEIEVDGILIALDDEAHFNPFRWQTLQSPVYKLPLLQHLQPYKEYCSCIEKSSLTGFPPEQMRDRKGMASVRFKKQLQAQRIRAFNDFLQDLLPLVHFMPILRLSVYDQLNTSQGQRALFELLQEDDPSNRKLLADYLGRQLKQLETAFLLGGG